jgi:hypothetical protein
MKIIDIMPSPRKSKRYAIILDNGATYHFGLKGGNTYIDHKNTIKRDNYVKRHMGNKRENYLIKNLIPSPALFSKEILWGEYTDIQDNIKALNKRFNN